MVRRSKKTRPKRKPTSRSDRPSRRSTYWNPEEEDESEVYKKSGKRARAGNNSIAREREDIRMSLNTMSPKRVYRSGKNKIVAGVCGGLAEYFGTDPTIIRLIWVIITLVTGLFAGIIAYLIAWAIIPRNPKHKWSN